MSQFFKFSALVCALFAFAAQAVDAPSTASTLSSVQLPEKYKAQITIKDKDGKESKINAYQFYSRMENGNLVTFTVPTMISGGSLDHVVEFGGEEGDTRANSDLRLGHSFRRVYLAYYRHGGHYHGRHMHSAHDAEHVCREDYHHHYHRFIIEPHIHHDHHGRHVTLGWTCYGVNEHNPWGHRIFGGH